MLDKKETKMAALSRYVELKYKDYHGIEEDDYFFLYNLEILPEHADLVVLLILAEYIQENGIDKHIELIYDEPFEYWTYAPVIRSYKEGIREKRSLWYSHYKKHGMVIAEKEFKELVRLSSPFIKYINKYIRTELIMIEVASVLLRFPNHRDYRDQGLNYDKVKKLTLYDLERVANHLFNAGGIEVLIKEFNNEKE